MSIERSQIEKKNQYRSKELFQKLQKPINMLLCTHNHNTEIINTIPYNLASFESIKGIGYKYNVKHTKAN